MLKLLMAVPTNKPVLSGSGTTNVGASLAPLMVTTRLAVLGPVPSLAV